MKSHTPGPWKFLAEVGRIEGGVTGESLVAYIAGRARKFASSDLTEAHANGTLIAAAPEMLEALQHAYNYLIGLHAYLLSCETSVIVDNLETTSAFAYKQAELVEAAIRKARGAQ